MPFSALMVSQWLTLCAHLVSLFLPPPLQLLFSPLPPSYASPCSPLLSPPPTFTLSRMCTRWPNTRSQYTVWPSTPQATCWRQAPSTSACIYGASRTARWSRRSRAAPASSRSRGTGLLFPPPPPSLLLPSPPPSLILPFPPPSFATARPVSLYPAACGERRQGGLV